MQLRDLAYKPRSNSVTSTLAHALMTAINRPTEVAKAIVVVRIDREFAETTRTPTNSSLRQFVIVVGIIIVTRFTRHQVFQANAVRIPNIMTATTTAPVAIAHTTNPLVMTTRVRVIARVNIVVISHQRMLHGDVRKQGQPKVW